MRARDIHKALRYPEKITSLNLRSSKPPLSKVPEAIFEFKNLEILDLSLNQLQTVPKTIFSAFPRLRELNLSKNSGLNLNFTAEGKNYHIKKLQLNKCGLEQLPGFLHQLEGLEHLEVANNRLVDIPFQTLFRLKSIDVSGNKFKTIPDAWIYWDALKTVELRNVPASVKRKIRIIDRYRSDFVRLSVDPEQRARVFSFFYKNEVIDLSLSDLLVAANLGWPEIRMHALEMIEKSADQTLSSSWLTDKTELVFTGRIPHESFLKTQLQDFGIAVNDFPGPKTTHLVVGEYPYTKPGKKDTFHPEILTSRNLFRALNATGNPASDDGAITAKIRQLIHSPVKSNVVLGFNLLRSSPVPDELITDLFLLWLDSRIPSEQRVLKEILELNGNSKMPGFLASYKPSCKGKKVSLKTCKSLGLDMTRIRKHLS